MGDMIRASVLVEPGKIEIQKFPMPKLEEGALLIKPLMSGICGTDKHGYRGEAVQYAGTPRETRGPYPAIPGHENVGEIVEIRPAKGEKMLDFYGKEVRKGDRVVLSPDILCGTCYSCRNSLGFTWCDNIRSYGHMNSSVAPHLVGGWSDLLYVFPGSHFYRISEDISDEIAVLAEPMAVTYSLDIAKGHSAMPNDGFMSGDTVVVYGVGPLGICHVIKARLLGAGRIVAVDQSDYRLSLAEEFGATSTLNVSETTEEDRRQSILDLTSGRGADVVVECAGVPSVVTEGLEVLRKGGTFVEVGHFVDVGDIQINPHRHLCAKNLRLIGLTNLAYTGFVPSMELMVLNQDRYDFNKLVTHRYHFTDALQGLMKSMEPDCMKVVLTS